MKSATKYKGLFTVTQVLPHDTEKHINRSI